MHRLTLDELAANYGTLELMTACIMRAADMSEEDATRVVYKMDHYIDLWIDAMKEEDE